MGRFQAMVNEGEGFQRKVRFYVNFTFFKGVDNIGIGLEFVNGQDTLQTLEEERQGFSTSQMLRGSEMLIKLKDVYKYILFCDINGYSRRCTKRN